MQNRIEWLVVVLAVSVWTGACNNDSPEESEPLSDVLRGSDLLGDNVDSPPEFHHVKMDLGDYTKGTPGAFVRQISDPADLLKGDTAQGQIGDWIMGNAKARFIIQGVDRHSTPCPYGGNVIDAAYKGAEGFGNDVMGEACTFLQLGRTLLPEHFEVLADGSDGPAILAVTGDDTLLDSLNIGSLMKSFVGDAISLPVEPEIDLEMTITHYFILSGDSNALRQITAFRNEGKTTSYLVFGDLVDSGGTVEFFNPASQKKGFGYSGFTPEVMDFLAFRGSSGSYAYVPEPKEDGAPNASYLAISGVAGIAVGGDSILTMLTQTPDALRENSATVVTEPGKTSSVMRTLVVGNNALSTITDTIYDLRKIKTGTVEISVEDEDGKPVPGLRVSMGSSGAVTQGVSDDNGVLTARLPAGDYKLMTDRAERRVLKQDTFTVANGEKATAKVTVEAQGHLNITVVDTLGEPTSAKVTVMCNGGCLEPPNSQQRDVSFDKLPAGVQAVVFLNVDGKSKIPVPSGEYRVAITRGPLWSAWPDNELSGQSVKVTSGKSTDVNATIQKVVPTPGWLSGDLHVHAINSPDSPIDNKGRVRSMLAEGVDVLVSSDHDYITDFGPTVKALGATHQISTVAGEELTTFDYGHFNVFPIPVDPEDLVGGAIDWGNGEEDNMHPVEIFETLQAFDGEQVVQINHPIGGYFTIIKLDAATGHTQAPPSQFRIADTDPDPETGDTGMFSDKWTAVELMNGLNGSRFYDMAGYWFTLLSRGLIRTGTAVSDTHRAISTQSGGSRTYVYVGEDHDTPDSFDENVFAKQLNAGHATGSNGPFVEFFAENPAGDKVMVGETLTMDEPDEVTFSARVSIPLWMNVSRVELVGNVTDVNPKPGSMDPTKFEPLEGVDVVLDDGHVVDNQRYEVTVTIPQKVDADGWYIVLVHGTASSEDNMFPVVPSTSVKPFAFSNPILVDVGNDGWKAPLNPKKESRETKSSNEHHPAPSARRVINLNEAQALLEHLRHTRNCSN